MMKRIAFLLVLLSAFATKSFADADPVFVKRFRNLMQLVRQDNAAELAKLVHYPLERPYPLPAIKNQADFVRYYPTLFDRQFKQLLSAYNDTDVMAHNDAYGLVGGRFSGEIWMDDKGKVITINYTSAKEKANVQAMVQQIKAGMHSSVRDWDENVIYARSEKLLVRVDRTSKGLRYVCWTRGKTMKDPPDLVLYDGVEEAQGSMGGWTWTFKNKDWTYIVDQADMCDEPSQCGLFLELLNKDVRNSRIKLRSLR